jgi:hypothetical protein
VLLSLLPNYLLKEVGVRLSACGDINYLRLAVCVRIGSGVWQKQVCLRVIGFVLALVGLLQLTGCASTSDRASFAEAGAVSVTAATKVVSYALSLQGAPYRYGKASPTDGFDCSGFVWHVYQQQGIVLPRTAQAMATQLPVVSKYAMHSGDLVFFNTTGRPFSHVGIYVENDNFIHAPSQRTGAVIVSNLNNTYWHQRFMAVRRPE